MTALVPQFLGMALLLISWPLGPGLAAMPSVERLDAHEAGRLWEVAGGALEAAKPDLLRWQPNAGETSTLSMRKDRPLFSRLRYFDLFQFEFRVVGGEINELGFGALGHVSGARQYKAHHWSVAVRTTERDTWHARSLDLARPNWFPWDNPDGQGPDGHFRFDTLALAPGTVIELRNLKLIRSLVILKPDYELPVTWPVKTVNEDGSVTYTTTFQALNASGGPTEITAAPRSAHPRFKVALDPQSVAVKHAQTATFTLTATLSQQDIARTEELYAEPVRLIFAPAHEPGAACLWQGLLVRPLSRNMRRQVVVAEDDLKTIKAGDAKIKAAVDYDKTVAAAEEFVAKRLDHIPPGQQHPGTRYPDPWRVGVAMPEAVLPKTGEREVGTHLAGQIWKEYLGYPGGACEKLGLAYLMAGDEKYAQKAVELFLLYARQYQELPWRNSFDPPWNQGPNILVSSRTAGNSSYGSNWYFKAHCRLLAMIAESPYWTAEQRDRVYRGFVLPYVTELLKFPAPISNMADITNHNVLLLGIVFDDALMVREALRRDAGVISRLGDMDSDGFSSEGRPTGYHYAGMAEYLPSLAYLANSRLPIAYPKEKLLAAFRMPFLRAALTGRIPNTGDCGRGQAAGNSHLADHLISIFPEERWLLDVGLNTTLAKKLRLALASEKPAADAWKKLLDPNPRLFAHAGLAIPRAGDAPETQIMVTLDYGLNVFHGHRDRNQITLTAFGKVFSHGPGSVYNVGSGGMTRTNDKRLDRFCAGGSLGQNVVLVDAQDQVSAVGELLAWSPKPDAQVAVSRVAGIRPGVAHTRGVLLTQGIVLVFDRLESKDEHTYDFAYHNFGKLALGEGWKESPCEKPLAATANYESIVDLKKLSGAGPLRLTWDLTEQVLDAEKLRRKKASEPLSPALLEFWQFAAPGGEVYTGFTGLNNPNTMTIPDAAASVFHRVRGQSASFVTVLEPHTGASRVKSVAADGAAAVVTLSGGERITASLDALVRAHAVRR